MLYFILIALFHFQLFTQRQNNYLAYLVDDPDNENKPNIIIITEYLKKYVIFAWKIPSRN